MDKRSGKIQNIIWTMLLVVYPFVGMNQGLSVVDTTYSLSNFAFFPEMKGTWAAATYLANALGYGLMQLPFGNTMLGMNFYTRFVIVIMAVISYRVLRKVFPAWMTAVSLLAAEGLCWAPSTTLYHYLTYLLIQLASLFLFKAFTVQEESRNKWFIAAGLCLGLNVGVRMPNVTHAALILAVWYGTCLTCKDKADRRKALWKNTLWCICGYLPGLLVPLAVLSGHLGIHAYPDMVRTLFAMTDKAQDYKPGAMVTGIFGGYLEGIRWILLLAACVIIGCAAAAALNKALLRRSAAEAGHAAAGRTAKAASVIFAAACVAVMIVLFRFFWGRGMFDFRYYYYGSVYNLTVLFLWIALAVCLYALFRKGLRAEWKLLAAVALLQMFLIPLGGNNGLYSVMNQMFLVLPVTLGLLYRSLASSEKPTDASLPMARTAFGNGQIDAAFPLKAAVVLTAGMLLVQSAGFHFCFALQDGVWGDKRDAVVTADKRVAGIYTTEQNAQTLEELIAYAKEQRLENRRVILYGEIPGLGYILHMPSALTTFWPDLDSYRTAECARDLEALQEETAGGTAEKPVVIVSSAAAAWMDDDAQGMKWFGADAETLQADEKLQRLRRFMTDNRYEQTFCNAAYAVYQ